MKCWNLIRSETMTNQFLQSPRCNSLGQGEASNFTRTLQMHELVWLLSAAQTGSRFMNDARVGKLRRCESVNTVPLLLHFFFSFFFILLLLKNNNHRQGITTMQSTAPFYDGPRCKTPPFSHSQSEWFLCTPWHVCNAVDRISNGVICEEDIMRYCVRPVYTTYANTNRHCLRFVFPRRHQCFWNEADSKHFLFVTLEVLMPPSLQEQAPRPLLES